MASLCALVSSSAALGRIRWDSMPLQQGLPPSVCSLGGNQRILSKKQIWSCDASPKEKSPQWLGIVFWVETEVNSTRGSALPGLPLPASPSPPAPAAAATLTASRPSHRASRPFLPAHTPALHPAFLPFTDFLSPFRSHFRCSLSSAQALALTSYAQCLSISSSLGSLSWGLGSWVVQVPDSEIQLVGLESWVQDSGDRR